MGALIGILGHCRLALWGQPSQCQWQSTPGRSRRAGRAVQQATDPRAAQWHEANDESSPLQRRQVSVWRLRNVDM
eukprot:5129280-Prymnesium_polylepis.1